MYVVEETDGGITLNPGKEVADPRNLPKFVATAENGRSDHSGSHTASLRAPTSSMRMVVGQYYGREQMILLERCFVGGAPNPSGYADIPTMWPVSFVMNASS